MLWVIYPLIVAILWSVIDILDKHIVSDELKDPFVCTVIFGFVSLILVIISGIFGDVFSVDPVSIFLLLLAGFIFAVANIFHVTALQNGKISKIAPLFPLRVLFLTLFAFIFLGERLQGLQYFGILVVIIGTILISYKHGEKYSISISLILMLVSILFKAMRDIFVRFGKDLGNYGLFQYLFWIWLGYFLVSLIIFIFHHPHIIKKAKKGIEHLILNKILAVISLAIYFYAISTYSVSMVAVITSLSPLFIFFLVLFFTKVKPKVIYEKFDKPNLIINLVATVLTVIGAIFILI